MFVVLSALALLATARCATAQDAVSFVPLQGVHNLYYFSDSGKEWMDAIRFCATHSSTLVSIESKAEFYAIVNHLNHIDDASQHSYWTSGSDQFDEGKFVWMSNGQPLNYSDWCRREPSDTKGTENCIQMVGSNGWCWNDAPCRWSKYSNIQFRFICEKSEFC